MIGSKKILAGSFGVLFGMGLALAQDAAPTGPIAPRTGAYGDVSQGNAASDNTVLDYTKRPTLIQGKQYMAAVAADNGTAQLGNGYFSFAGKGLDWFGSVTASSLTGAGAGEMRAGAAAGTWGAGVVVDFKKTWIKDPAGNKTKAVVAGDGYGGFVDFGLGRIGDVYGEVISYTSAPYSKTDVPAAETNPWMLHFLAGWKKDATTEGTHAFNVEALYNLSSSTVDPGGIKTKVNAFGVMFSHGYILKASQSYSVFLGSNNSLAYSTTDNPAPTADPDFTTVSLSPNMVFQKQLGKGFETFAGASGSLVFAMGNAGVGDAGNSTLNTTGADASVGLRWAKDNFALEGTVNQALLKSGPNFIGGNGGTANGNGLFAKFGLALGI